MENKLLALAFKALIVLGFEVWFWNGCGPDQYFPSVFEVTTKFPLWKFDSISPYFCGGNLVAVCLRCVIACQTLFLPSFRCEKMTMVMPHFHGKNSADFRIYCDMAHWQGFASMYMVRINMLASWRAEALQSVRTCRYVSHTWGNQMSHSDMDWDNHTAMIVHTI